MSLERRRAVGGGGVCGRGTGGSPSLTHPPCPPPPPPSPFPLRLCLRAAPTCDVFTSSFPPLYAADTRVEPRDKVLLRVQVPTTLDSSVDEEEEWQDGQLTASKTSIAQLTCKLIASFSGTETISNLLISVKVPDAVTTRQATICIPTLGALCEVDLRRETAGWCGPVPVRLWW